ncbi:ankyrin repeat domain-containing protein [Chryseobacterium indologenes]|nr:ankyrin repeat domain-containing protein [Chryseobacterium indologenes]
MNKNNIDKVFQYVRLNQVENLKKEVNSSNVNDFINEYDENLLQEAISSKAFEIIKYLLECDININHADRDGKTPLHFSTAYNDYDTTQFLLDNKSIEIDKKDIHGNNPMWVATFNARGYYDVVKLLKQAGANPNSKNNNNKSALDFAKQIEDQDLEKILAN